MDRRNFVEIVLLTILSSKISFSKNEEPIIFNKNHRKSQKKSVEQTTNQTIVL